MKFLGLLLFSFFLFLAACSESRTLTPSGTQPTSGQKLVRVSAEGKSSSEISIASASEGRVFAVWSERDENKRYDVFVREYSPDLEPKGQAVRVNPNPGEARSWYGDAPTILVAPDNKIYVGWNRRYAGGSAGNDLVLSTSTDGGMTFGEPLKVNDDRQPASHGMHATTLDPQGRVLISWLDERYLKANASNLTSTGGPILAMLLNPTPNPAAKQSESEEPDAELYFAIVAEGKLVGPNRRIAQQICPCCRVSLAAAADGTIYAAYRRVFPGDFRHIAVSTSTDRGETFSDPVQVSDDQWKLFACPVSGAALRTNGRDLQVAWYSGGGRGEKGLYQTVSSDRAKTFSPPELITNTMLKGSPVFAGSEIVFGDTENIYRGPVNAVRRIADGTTPSAAQGITAFASASGNSSAIWLTK